MLDYPGSLAFSQSTMEAFCTYICRSLHHNGTRKVIMLNGHGGNREPLTRTGRNVRELVMLVAIVEWWNITKRLQPGLCTDGTHIVARARIASQETPVFALEPAAIVVSAAPDFNDDQTTCTVEPARDVEPGNHVTIRLRATNAGSMAAQSVTAAVTLPEGLLAVRGSTRVDGKPVRERKKDGSNYELGRIEARACVELRCEAVVATPAEHGAQLPVNVALRWAATAGSRETQERLFERTLTVKSEPYLPARRNFIERVGSVAVGPAGEGEAVLVVANDGRAAATDAGVLPRASASTSG